MDVTGSTPGVDFVYNTTDPKPVNLRKAERSQAVESAPLAPDWLAPAALAAGWPAVPGRSKGAIPAQSRRAAPLPPIRVLIVDDHPVARQGLQHILGRQGGIQVVGEAGDGPEAIVQTRCLQPDVVLLDLELSRLPGLATLRGLRMAHPPAEVVILTVLEQDEPLFASLKAGARSYLLKDAAPEMIVEAVRAAGQGQSLFSPRIATRVVARLTMLAQQEIDPDALTERELQVLQGMVQGLGYKQIARQLSIAVKTVQYHVTHILGKLHVANRSAAVVEAVKRGLGELK